MSESKHTRDDRLIHCYGGHSEQDDISSCPICDCNALKARNAKMKFYLCQLCDVCDDLKEENGQKHDPDCKVCEVVSKAREFLVKEKDKSDG